eukprot:TRINITY_DN8320_c0_g1_i6.p2 TRINITY_DN8320_c0_g1~~TRINITY_DN8320_c0_g1_i6.p2  ORF type:complete len:196 (+),score=26.42 TRINITY_DN8320_c0_g1_i6:803-1390(+)
MNFEGPINFRKAGNPGYIEGSPLIIGAARQNDIKNATVVESQYPYYNLKGINSDGSCLREQFSKDLLFYDRLSEQKQIRFGYNSVFTCSVSLNRAELESFCNGPAIKGLTVVSDILQNFEYVGILGNPERININDWQRVEVSNSSIDSTVFERTACKLPSLNSIEIHSLLSSAGSSYQHLLLCLWSSPAEAVQGE